MVASVKSIGAITLSVLALAAPVVTVGLVAGVVIVSLNKFEKGRVTHRN